MQHTDEPATHEHADHIESVLETGMPVSINPDGRSVRQVTTLSLIDGTDWAPKARRAAGLDFHERNGGSPLNDEV